MEPQEYPTHRTPSPAQFKERIKTPYVVYIRSSSDPTIHIEAGTFTTKDRAQEYMDLHAQQDPVLVVDPKRYL